MEELKKNDKESKCAEREGRGGYKNPVHTKISSEVQLLKSDIDTISSGDSLKPLYDFEKENADSRKVFYKKKHSEQSRKVKDDVVKKRVIDAWRYFYAARNLPLAYILKSTGKLVYMDEFLQMEEESKEIRIFKKIEKLRRKGMLVQEVFDDEESSNSEGAADVDLYTIDRVRRCLFRRRVLVVRNKKLREETVDEGFERNSEYYKCVQRSVLKKKKEPLRKENTMHPSQMSILGKIPSEIRSLATPADIVNFRSMQKLYLAESQGKAMGMPKSGYKDTDKQHKSLRMSPKGDAAPPKKVGADTTGMTKEVFFSNVRTSDSFGHLHKKDQ